MNAYLARASRPFSVKARQIRMIMKARKKMSSRGILFRKERMSRSLRVKSPAARYSYKKGSTNQFRMKTDQ